MSHIRNRQYGKTSSKEEIVNVGSDSRKRKQKQSWELFFEELGAAAKLAKSNFGSISWLGALISAILSFGILMTYAKAIGRIDLLPLVLEKKFAALLPWMGLAGLLLLLYMVIMLTTTIIYAMAVSTFGSASSLQAHIARLLLAPAIVGSSAFMIVVFRFPTAEHWLTAPIIMLFSLLAMLLALRSVRFRTGLQIVALASFPRDLASWRSQTTIFISAYLVVAFAVFAAAFPMSLLLRSYIGADTPDAANTLMILSILAMALLFLPALIFFVSRRNIASRMLRSFAAALAIIVGVVIVFPGASSTIVYTAAGMMGVREQTVSQYRIMKGFELKDFDEVAWGVQPKTGLPVVAAFPLFSLGDVLLLCPGSLLKTPLGDWPKYSHACVSTQSSDVVKLPKATAAS
ncbi:hypothetical protein [Pseudomonas abieticivorans]|uniref:hypothetical protein n=1 Tax=Pseudomonas abieticivorans TaxID=2931382 RepID=UPI0020BE4274|nr:hypothetical protein [Pseudomonas sp. PIA16]